MSADIFAHMLIGQRHDKAVQTLPLQLLAQRIQAIFISGHCSFLDLDLRLPTYLDGARLANASLYVFSRSEGSNYKISHSAPPPAPPLPLCRSAKRRVGKECV